MSGRFLAAAVAAPFALLFGSGTCSAGPIGWGYRTTVDGRVTIEKSGLTEADLYYPWQGFGGYNHWLALPMPGYLRGQFRTYDEHGLRYDVWRTEGTVTITDEASGEEGHFVWWYEQQSGYTRFPDGDRQEFEHYISGPKYAPIWLRLGGNVYHVTAAREDGSMWVSARPASTPEPATLAMAGLGLGAAGLIRARRR